MTTGLPDTELIAAIESKNSLKCSMNHCFMLHQSTHFFMLHHLTCFFHAAPSQHAIHAAPSPYATFCTISTRFLCCTVSTCFFHAAPSLHAFFMLHRLTKLLSCCYFPPSPSVLFCTNTFLYAFPPGCMFSMKLPPPEKAFCIIRSWCPNLL